MDPTSESQDFHGRRTSTLAAGPSGNSKTSKRPKSIDKMFKLQLSKQLKVKETKGHHKSRENIQRLLEKMLKSEKVTLQVASEGPSTSSTADVNKLPQRRRGAFGPTSKESENSKEGSLKGRIDVVENGVKTRRSARLRGKVSVIPPVKRDLAREVAQHPEPERVLFEPAGESSAGCIELRTELAIMVDEGKVSDRRQELPGPGPSRKSSNTNAIRGTEQTYENENEVFEDQCTRESFSVDDFELYAVIVERLPSEKLRPLYLSDLVRSRSKLVWRSGTWNLEQLLGFGQTDFKFISPRPKPRFTRTSFSSIGSERSSAGSARSSTNSNRSTYSEPQDVHSDGVEPEEEVNRSSKAEDHSPSEAEIKKMSFDPLNGIQIWARRRSEAGGLYETLVVQGALGNRCRLGHSPNSKFYYVLYASESNVNVQKSY